MPMPEACIAAAKIANAIAPQLDPPKRDRWKYVAVMNNDAVPLRTSPTVEIEWLAFSLSKTEPEYKTAPSKIAATWLRRLRLKKVLKDKFWSDTWPYYMENRLAIELRAVGPKPKSAKSVGQKSNSEMADSIDRMTGPKAT